MGPGVLSPPAWLVRVRRAVLRYGMLARGDRMGVAVSGGADSVALLHALRLLRDELGVDLEVLHLDHGLRGEESAGDARFVEQLASRLGLPFHLRRAALAGEAGNLEQAARRARLAFFAEMKAERGLDRVATGHTWSDQAETVLFRLLRGCGPGGLAGVLPVTREGLIRPLLDVTREEARQWLRAHGEPWREDSTNASRTLARNRIRLDLLPALARDWNPELEAALARFALLAGEEELFWAAQVEQALASLAVERSGSLVLKIGAIVVLPVALARRVLRAAAERVVASPDWTGCNVGLGRLKPAPPVEACPPLPRLGFQHVETLLEMVRQQEGDGRASLPGLDAWRSFDWLRLSRPGPPPARNWAIEANSGEHLLPGGSSVVLQVMEGQGVDTEGEVRADSLYNEVICRLDWNSLGRPLILRAWRPGDVYQPEGLAVEEKLKTLFQRDRIPSWDRRDWPILTAGGEVVWARRFGAAARHRAHSATGKWLQIVDRPGTDRVR
jgi:tRNA(Ile)-lysidine synthase